MTVVSPSIWPSCRVGRSPSVARHEAAIDVDDPAVVGLQRRHHQIAEAAERALRLGQRVDDVDLLVVEEAAGDRRPAGTRARRDRGPAIRRAGRRQPAARSSRALDPRDQRLLPGEALELPDAERRRGWRGRRASAMAGSASAAPAARTAQSVSSRPVFGPVPVLLGDHQALQRPEQADRQAEHQRNPEEGVQPVRRVEGELDEQRQADDDEADDHHDEDRRTVAGIGEGEIEPADLAARRDGRGSPSNSRPSPQRGQRPRMPVATAGSGG